MLARGETVLPTVEAELPGIFFFNLAFDSALFEMVISQLVEKIQASGKCQINEKEKYCLPKVKPFYKIV